MERHCIDILYWHPPVILKLQLCNNLENATPKARFKILYIYIKIKQYLWLDNAKDTFRGHKRLFGKKITKNTIIFYNFFYWISTECRISLCLDVMILSIIGTLWLVFTKPFSLQIFVCARYFDFGPWYDRCDSCTNINRRCF